MYAPEEFALKLCDHDNKINNLEKRVEKAESTIEEIRNLTTSVQLMAQKQGDLIESVDKLSNKVESLDAQPKETWNKVKTAAISATITALVASVVAAIINFI